MSETQGPVVHRFESGAQVRDGYGSWSACGSVAR